MLIKRGKLCQYIRHRLAIQRPGWRCSRISAGAVMRADIVVNELVTRIGEWEQAYPDDVPEPEPMLREVLANSTLRRLLSKRMPGRTDLGLRKLYAKFGDVLNYKIHTHPTMGRTFIWS